MRKNKDYQKHEKEKNRLKKLEELGNNPNQKKLKDYKK